MELAKLIEGLPVISIEGPINKDVTRVVYDSRRAVPGALFVCIDGFKTDGHKFASFFFFKQKTAYEMEL